MNGAWTHPEVREAQVADIGEIVRVNNQNLGQGEGEGGFPLDALAQPDVRDVLLLRGEDRVWIEVAERDTSKPIRGFVWASPAAENDVLERVLWKGRRWERALRAGEALYVRKIAVDPACRGLGVGERLYRHVFQRHAGQVFYCFVAREPRDNRESLAFHHAQGFVEAGEFRAEKFYGWKHYRSVLLVHRAEELRTFREVPEPQPS